MPTFLHDCVYREPLNHNLLYDILWCQANSIKLLQDDASQNNLQSFFVVWHPNKMSSLLLLARSVGPIYHSLFKVLSTTLRKKTRQVSWSAFLPPLVSLQESRCHQSWWALLHLDRITVRYSVLYDLLCQYLWSDCPTGHQFAILLNKLHDWLNLLI